MKDIIAIGYAYDRYNTRNDGAALAVARYRQGAVRVVSVTRFSRHEYSIQDSTQALQHLALGYAPDAILIDPSFGEFMIEQLRLSAPQFMKNRILRIHFAGRVLVDGERYNVHEAVNSHLATLVKEDRLLLEGTGVMLDDKDNPLDSTELTVAEAIGLACFGIEKILNPDKYKSPFTAGKPSGAQPAGQTVVDALHTV